MKFNLYTTPLLILLMDGAPLAVVEEPPGEFRLALGVGAATFEAKTFSCSGSLISADPVKVQSVGGLVEYRGPAVRFTAWGGITNFESDRFVSQEYEGPYMGVQIAEDAGAFGIGIGAAYVGGSDQFIAPSIYIRGGHLEKAHFRFDLFPPTETFSSWSWLRMGIGVNRTGNGVGYYLGVGMLPYTYSDQFEPRLLGELDIPVGSDIELFMRGQIGPGQNEVQWGFGSGISVRMGAN